MKVEINKIFTVEKGKRKARWKVMEHPNFPGQLTLVRDYAGMMSYFQEEDSKHIGGCVTIENAYSVAYALT